MKLLFLSISCFVVFFNLNAQNGKLNYEKRTDLLNDKECKASEAYLKKKIKAQLASAYTDYPEIAVDFKSFKGQNGYSDNLKPGRFVYPYKIEMLVYVKRKLIREGKEKTEIITWKYDAVYEYATMKGGKCEMIIVPSSQITRINQQLF